MTPLNRRHMALKVLRKAGIEVIRRKHTDAPNWYLIKWRKRYKIGESSLRGKIIELLSPIYAEWPFAIWIEVYPRRTAKKNSRTLVYSFPADK
jgi:hypothetical protein